MSQQLGIPIKSDSWTSIGIAEFFYCPRCDEARPFRVYQRKSRSGEAFGENLFAIYSARCLAPMKGFRSSPGPCFWQLNNELRLAMAVVRARSK